MHDIPTQLKELANSPDLYLQSEKVGKKFDLHIDQIGELDAEIRDVLDGFSKSSDFIKHIMERLEIDRVTADKITEEVNKEVFSSIRDQLQKMQSGIKDENAVVDEQITIKTQQNIADLERVGGFTIEPTGQNGNGNGNGAVPANLPGAEIVTESKEDLLSGIENPTSMMTSNPILTRPSIARPEIDHTDILVDHLLANPTGAAEEKIAKPVKMPTSIPIAKETPKKAPTADSYREPIE
jgi:hypothetical protein